MIPEYCVTLFAEAINKTKVADVSVFRKIKIDNIQSNCFFLMCYNRRVYPSFSRFDKKVSLFCLGHIHAISY